MKSNQIGSYLACVFLLFVLPTAGQKTGNCPAHSSVALDASKCRPATSEQKKWVGSAWAQFESYEIACPLRSRAGSIVLYVVSVNGYDIAKTVTAGSPQPKLPKALLVSPQGQILGTLPYAFPFDMPVSLGLTFAHWSHGFPQVLELFLEDPAVGGNKKLPSLKWDAKQSRYVETEVANGG
jgi:hypothetical protein